MASSLRDVDYMASLKFDHFQKFNSHKPRMNKSILGFGILVGFIALGSTLAASINLNDGTPVEFGQGVAQTTACDSNITITPFSSFVNSEENPDFYFNSFSVSDISSSCSGKIFTIKAYKNDENSALELYNSNGTVYSEINIMNEDGNFSFIGGGLDSGDIQNIANGFRVTIGEATQSAFSLVSGQDLDRITIESKDSLAGTSSGYQIGDIGPGGGNIFYVSENGFNCGSEFSNDGSPTSGLCHYLEAAPYDWFNPGIAMDDPSIQWSVESNWQSNLEAIANEYPANNTTAGIGLGFKNTLAIIAQNGSYDPNTNYFAAGAAQSFRGGTKDDWYLPTASELNQMCKWARGVPEPFDENVCSGGALNSGTQASGFKGDYYWSSSEAGMLENVWFQNFSNGGQLDYSKNNSYYVRPIRAF